MQNKSVSEEEEVGYYKPCYRFTNHIRMSICVYDVLSIYLSLYVRCLFYQKLSNFGEEILLKGAECNNPAFQTLC